MCLLLVQSKPESKILDAGCGPGTITSSMAALIPTSLVVGVDFSESVIEKARAQSNLPPNCSFQAADITSLPFEDGSFDVVYTSQVLCHISAATSALVELRRVCKPGGFVACREGDIPATMIFPSTSALKSWKEAMIKTALQNKCDPAFGRALISLALDAGFDSTDIDFSIGAIKYAGTKEADFWGNTMAARVMEDHIWREKAMQSGIVEADFPTMRDGWLAFAQDNAAVFAMPCGQVICTKREE